MKNELPKMPLTNAEKQTFQRLLLRWFDTHQRILPWRTTPTPYRVWISEAMLQQTQVATVIPYFERFMQQFPDVHTLAAADSKQVLKLWEGLGYYSRARNLHRAAQIICEKYDGRIPDDERALRSLPGIGPYIAAAVLSIAFQQPYAVVDGNVKRVLARVCGDDFPVNQPQSHKHFQPLADALFNTRRPGDHNQALMELGALVCRPQQPDCGSCPVASCCRAYVNQRQCELPVTVKRPQIPKKEWLAIVIRRGQQLLLGQRPDNGLLGGLWQFPTLEAIPEQLTAAKVRDLVEKQFHLPVQRIEKLPVVRHAFTHFKVTVRVYEAVVADISTIVHSPENHRWIPADKVGEVPMSKIHLQILQHLATDDTPGP
jgi:A/G-specific adenine glycosylase